MTTYLPAQCTNPDCGHQWTPTQGIMFSGTTRGNTFHDVTTNCPRCGGLARFLEGTVNVVDGAIEIVSGPQWSWDLVNALGLALRRAVEEGADPADAVQHLSPEVARGFRAATMMKSREFKLAVAGALYEALTTDYQVLGQNVMTVVETAQALLRYVAENGRLPGS